MCTPCFNPTYLCAAELDEGLEKEEAVTGDTHEEGERSRQNDAHSQDGRVEEMPSVKQAEPRECLNAARGEFKSPCSPQVTCVLVTLVLPVVPERTKEGRLGGLTPVSRANARHMCVDLSDEGLAALNRRGIAVIAYGAPLTGEATH